MYGGYNHFMPTKELKGLETSLQATVICLWMETIRTGGNFYTPWVIERALEQKEQGAQVDENITAMAIILDFCNSLPGKYRYLLPEAFQ